MRRVWHQCCDERGIALVIALSIMALLLVSGVFLLRMSSMEGDIAYNTVWAEGSFFAADAAINVAVDTIAPNVQDCTAARTAIGNGFEYQVQNNTPPGNTSCLAGTQQEAGYSLGTGTGYNPSGFVFYTFGFSGSGFGPRSAQRTIDAQATYGPIAQ